MNTTMESVNQPELVTKKIRKLSVKVRKLADAATLISFAGIMIGVVMAFLVTPPVSVVGASVAVIVTYGVKFYAMARKREMTNEVLDLKSRQILSDTEADRLKNEIKQIYGEPQK